jgi:hypothetical protein
VAAKASWLASLTPSPATGAQVCFHEAMLGTFSSEQVRRAGLRGVPFDG